MSHSTRDELCGCCEGPDARTPLTIFNRPGLSALAYRAGTYALFLETMLARLGQVTLPPEEGSPPPPASPAPSPAGTGAAPDLPLPAALGISPAPLHPLAGLRTRAPGDPAIALLDAWAVALDVLTFYDERIANEGYLRTARERRSLVELARLVGYTPRPGLSATAYLAFTIDSANPSVTIPAETKVQSTPEQGSQNELPQTFETAEPAEARPAWNAIRPRLSQPQYLVKPGLVPQLEFTLYVKSPNPALKPNDPLLLEFAPEKPDAGQPDPGPSYDLYRVVEAPVLTPSPEEAAASGPNSAAEKARLRLGEWEQTSFGLPQTGYPMVFWNTVQYYQTAFEAYSGSRIAEQALTALSSPEFMQLVVTEVVANSHVTFKVHNAQPSLMLMVEMRAAADTDGEWIEVGRFVSGSADLDPEDREEIPEPLIGAEEIDLRLVRRLPLPRQVLITRFKNSDEFKQDVQEGREAAPIGEMAAELGRTRNTLDARYNRFVRLLESARAELELVRRAYEIQAAELSARKAGAAPAAAAVGTHGANEAAVLAVIDALRETTALIGDLERAPRVRPLLEPLLAAKIQEYQQALLSSKASVSDQVAQSRKGSFSGVLDAVRARPADRPSSSRQLTRSTASLYRAASDLGTRLLTRVSPRSGPLYSAWSSSAVPQVYARTAVEVMKNSYVMRVRAGLFGQQLPGNPQFQQVDVEGGGTLVQISGYSPFKLQDIWPDAPETETRTVFLDREYDKILPESLIVIESRFGRDIFRVRQVGTRTLSAFGVSVPVTALELYTAWKYRFEDDATRHAQEDTRTLRSARVYAQSEPLELVDEPVDLDIGGPMVELDGLYEGLQSGKWVIVEGERTDLPGTARVRGAELVMISNVIQDVQMVDEDTPLPGDRPHTFLQLARQGLAYRYRRSTVKVHANVVRATHGETHSQVLGSGDASRPFQSFELRFRPLTYLPAPTADGARAALEIRVDNVLWHEAPNIAVLGPTDREYLVKIDDDGKTSVIFGDGWYGARLPTAPENVRARYRSGLGQAGNVRGGGINLLLSRPPGVKEVNNPLPATGGADREGPEGIRRSAPLALKALDRLVSVQDYEDFCRIYAGVGKSRAVELPAVGGFLVHITVAGDADIPIDPLGDLYRNLVEALRRLGDPHQPFRVALRERILPVISAGVRLQPDYAWEFVEPRVRAALLKLLSFEYRELGQDITSSDVIAAIQNVPGVLYTDLDVLDSVDQARLESFLRLQGEQKGEDRLDLAASLNLRLRRRIPVALARPDRDRPLVVLPAQIAYLDEDIRDLLILKEIVP